MNSLVFDSSAILTLYYDEPGKKKVRSLLDKSEPLISTVNLCEIFTKLVQNGLRPDVIQESFDGLEVEVVEFDSNQALRAAELRVATKHLGLSLGDRACLALAIQKNAIAVTADRNWKDLDVCRIELIR